MSFSTRHTSAKAKGGPSYLGHVWLTLLSLSLLLGGPGHVVFHGSVSDCHSGHAEQAGGCHSAELSGLHGASSADQHADELASVALVSDEVASAEGSRVALVAGHSDIDHDCVHCLQVATEAPLVSLSASGFYDGNEICHELRREVLSRGSFDVPSPRGPPSRV